MMVRANLHCMRNPYHRSALAERFPRVLKRRLDLGKKRKKDIMVQNVVITLDLGKGVNLERVQLSFHGAFSASLDFMSTSEAGIVSIIQLDMYSSTIHLLLLTTRRILWPEDLSTHDGLRSPIKIESISASEASQFAAW